MLKGLFIVNQEQSGTNYLSTTALAKKIGKDSRELFALLSEGGWLIKVDKQWRLTAKGVFEGGVLLDHSKYGEYVAWPDALLSHPMLGLLPAAPWGASRLAAKLQLPARLLNMLLVDLNLLTPGPKGWLLTPAGKECGGELCRNDSSGIPFARWPESLLNFSPLVSAVKALQVENCSLRSLSGRQFELAELSVIDSWLYLQGFHYSNNRQISPDSGSSDFYFPAKALHLFYWPSELNAAELATRLKATEQLASRGGRSIEMRANAGFTLQWLDETLPKLLMEAGIAAY